MKVTIRYTVDLEEVLGEMTDLYYKSVDTLDKKIDIYDSFLRDEFKETEVEHIISALHHKVDCYAEHQTKIAEILNILKGYQGIKDGSIQPPPEEPTSEDD